MTALATENPCASARGGDQPSEIRIERRRAQEREQVAA